MGVSNEDLDKLRREGDTTGPVSGGFVTGLSFPQETVFDHGMKNCNICLAVVAPENMEKHVDWHSRLIHAVLNGGWDGS